MVLTHVLLEDRHTDDVIIDSFCCCESVQLKMTLQKKSKYGKNISDTLASCATFLILSHFDVICDLLLNSCTVQEAIHLATGCYRNHDKFCCKGHLLNLCEKLDLHVTQYEIILALPEVIGM